MTQFRFRTMSGAQELSWQCDDTISIGVWSLITAAWNGGNTSADTDLYLNGVLCTKTNLQSGNPGAFTVTDMWVGGRWGTHEQDFHGAIDGVWIISEMIDADSASFLNACVDPY